MNNLFKVPIFIKQRIDSPKEFCRGSNDRLFIGLAFTSFLLCFLLYTTGGDIFILQLRGNIIILQ